MRENAARTPWLSRLCTACLNACMARSRPSSAAAAKTIWGKHSAITSNQARHPDEPFIATKHTVSSHRLVSAFQGTTRNHPRLCSLATRSRSNWRLGQFCPRKYSQTPLPYRRSIIHRHAVDADQANLPLVGGRFFGHQEFTRFFVHGVGRLYPGYHGISAFRGLRRDLGGVGNSIAAAFPAGFSPWKADLRVCPHC